MNAEFSVISGPNAGQRCVIGKDKFLIGREVDCDFRPNSELVSRHHCVLRQDDFTLRVRDMGSRNGTFVNGNQIHGEVVLADGDTIFVGDTTLKIVIQSQLSPASSSAMDSEILRGDVLEGSTMLQLGPPPPVPGKTPAVPPVVPEA